MRTAALVYNPVSGKRRAPQLAHGVVEVLSDAGWQVQSTPTDAPGAATTMARQLAHQGLVDAVFALGGDGTLREVAIGLMGSGVPMGPLPGGTTNVLVRSLGLPQNPARATRALLAGNRATWRVGLCGETPFLMMASAGYDAEVVHRMDPVAKARWGQLAVGALGLGVWWRFGYPRFEARMGSETLACHFASVSNIPQYAGSFAIAPAADPTASSLELVCHSSPGRMAALGFARDLALGRHVRRRDVAVRTASELEIDGPAGLLLQVDGDPCAEQLPVRVGLAPERLEMLVP